MRLVLLSDTHNLHRQISRLPEGDVVVHAGDMTDGGTLGEVEEFFAWFGALPHPGKIVVAGNHDFAFEETPAAALALVPANVTYLQDSGCEMGGIRFWGSPWQPWFYDWAFNARRGPEIARIWAQIPDDVGVLITHGPPHGILDQTYGGRRSHVGCEELAARMSTLTYLRLHAFGHIHEGYGREQKGGVLFVNASICNAEYQPTNPPIVVDL